MPCRLFRSKQMLIVISLASFSLIPFKQASAKSYWLTGGLIGAGVGAAAGGTLGYVGCLALQEEPTDKTTKCYATVIPLGGIVAGGAGFGIGALIGSAFKKNLPSVNLIMNPGIGTYGAVVMKSF